MQLKIYVIQNINHPNNLASLIFQNRQKKKMHQNSLSQSFLRYSQQKPQSKFSVNQQQNKKKKKSIKNTSCYNYQKAEQYEKFIQLMGKKKQSQHSIKDQIFLSQNSIICHQQQIDHQNQVDDIQCDFTFSQINQRRINQINLVQRIKKYQRIPKKTIYDLLPIKQKLLRDYILSKNKNYKKIMENNKNSSYCRHTQILSDFIEKKQCFKSKHSNNFIKNSQQNIVSCTRNDKQIQAQSMELKQNISSQKKDYSRCIQGDNSKFQIMIQKNNQYFQQMHQSVVNRLLNIIQNNQSMTNAKSQNTSINLSRVHQFQSAKIDMCRGKLSEHYSNCHDNHHNKKNQNFPTQRQDNHQRSMSKQQCCHKKQQKPCHEGSKTKNVVINNIYPAQKSTKKEKFQNYNLQKKQKQIYQLEAHRNFVSSIYNTPSSDNSHKIYSKFNHKQIDQVTDIQQSLTYEQNFQAKYKKNLSQTLIPLVVDGSKRKRISQNLIDDKDEKSIIKHIQYLDCQAPQTVRENKIKNQIFQTPIQTHLHSIQGVDTIMSEVPKKTDTIESKNVQIQERIRKDPVLLEIPINESSYSGLTLAQAFSKKLGGRLPSQQRKNIEKSHNISTNSYSEAKQSSNNKCVIANRAYNKNKQNVIRQSTVTRQISNSKSKQNKQKLKMSNISSVNMSNFDIVSPQSVVSLAEPSQQLLNRLIEGSRVKVPKKQMFALTRKNYENLPEVKEKKDRQRKKLVQKQRLDKIKQYQKAIRKNSRDHNLKNNHALN